MKMGLASRFHFLDLISIYAAEKELAEELKINLFKNLQGLKTNYLIPCILIEGQRQSQFLNF